MREYRLRIKNDCLSPCTIIFKKGWSNTLYTRETGEVWEVSKSSPYWFKIPKNLQVGQNIQITCRKNKSSVSKTVQLLKFTPKRAILCLNEEEESFDEKEALRAFLASYERTAALWERYLKARDEPKEEKTELDQEYEERLAREV